MKQPASATQALLYFEAQLMDQIQKLALLLKEAQLSQKSNYLPERYCVDLIDLACKRGFINVVHTQDGKEYLTVKRIKKEIGDKTSENGGRILISHLQQSLNIDQSHVLKYCKEFCGESNGKAVLLNDDEIITTVYLDRIVQEIRDILQTKGIMNYSELTKRFSLPLDFLFKAFKDRSDQTLIQFENSASGTSFVSEFYYIKQRARIHGYLIGCLTPCPFSKIAKSLELKQSIITKIASELLADNKIIGTVYNSVYFPKTTFDKLHDFLFEKIQTVCYLSYKFVKDLIPIDPQVFLQEIFKSTKTQIHYLSKTAVSQDFLDNIFSKIAEIIQSDRLMYTSELFDDNFDYDDKISVLELCFKKLNIILDSDNSKIIFFQKSGLIFSCCVLESLTNKMVALTKEDTRQLLLYNQNFKNILINLKNEMRLNVDSGSKKRQKPSKYTSDSTKIVSEYFPLSKFVAILQNDLEVEEAEEIISRAYQKFSHVAINVALETLNLFSQENETLVQNSPSKKDTIKERVTLLVDGIVSRFNLLLLYHKSAKIFETDVSENMVKYLLKSIGTMISENLLRIYILRIFKGVKISEKDYELLTSDEELSHKERSSLLKIIPTNSHAESFKSLFHSLKDWNGFLEEIHRIKDRTICNIQLKSSLSKADIKSSIEVHIEYLSKILSRFIGAEFNSSNIFVAFHACVSTFFAKYCQQYLNFPPKYMPEVIAKFSNLIEPSTKTLIMDVQFKIVGLLFNKTPQEAPLSEQLIANTKYLVDESVQLIKEMP